MGAPKPGPHRPSTWKRAASQLVNPIPASTPGVSHARARDKPSHPPKPYKPSRHPNRNFENSHPHGLSVGALNSRATNNSATSYTAATGCKPPKSPPSVHCSGKMVLPDRRHVKVRVWVQGIPLVRICGLISLNFGLENKKL